METPPNLLKFVHYNRIYLSTFPELLFENWKKINFKNHYTITTYSSNYRHLLLF